VQLPTRGAALARRDHLVEIDLRHHWRHCLDAFGRRPRVTVVVDIDLDDVPVRVIVINGRPDAMVGRSSRRDASALQPGIGAKQLVERVALESDVLQRPVATSLCIGSDSRHLEEHDPVIGLIVAQKRHG
jgi:hypothetical protein